MNNEENNPGMGFGEKITHYNGREKIRTYVHKLIVAMHINEFANI